MANELKLDDLDKLEKLDREATPGPWHREMLELGKGGPLTLGIGSEARAVCIVHGIVESPVGLRDVALVTALRNAATVLIAAARELAELKGALEFVTCFAGFEVLNESCPEEPMFCARIDDHMSQTKDSAGAAVVALARELGWTGKAE